MTRDGLLHPRWAQRTEKRRSGRYDGDKVVRWIARPNLLRKREQDSADASQGQDGAGRQPLPNGFTGLRLVSDR